MWLSEKNAHAMKRAQAVPSARRSNVRSSQAFGKAEPTFYVCPPAIARPVETKTNHVWLAPTPPKARVIERRLAPRTVYKSEPDKGRKLTGAELEARKAELMAR